MVLEESGKSYDPRVVEILARRYRQLEEEAVRLNRPAAKLSVDARIERGTSACCRIRPAAPASRRRPQRDFRSQIAAAGREAQYTLELVSELGNSLGMAEMLSVLSSRLTQLIPCDSIAVYEREDDLLRPVYVDGQDRMLFSSLQIPLGEGLSGWVAKHNKPILNGNPSVEPGYLNDPKKFSLLRSALSVPLAGQENTVGVLISVSRRRGCLRTRSLAHSFRAQCKNRPFVRERAEISGAGSVRDHRLSYRLEQYASVVRAAES